MNKKTKELSFKVTEREFFTVLYRLPANELYRLIPGSDTLQ
jgi:hypothetical protein